MKINRLVWLIVAFVIVVPRAFATCPTPPSYHSIGSISWYDYTPTRDCFDWNAAVDTTTLWCYEQDGWEVGTGLGQIDYLFVADPAINGWEAEALIEFDDPNNSSNNFVRLWAGVKHTTTWQWTLLFEHDGSDGDLSCDLNGGNFEAAEGDDVWIAIETYKASGNVTIQVGVPAIRTTNY